MGLVDDGLTKKKHISGVCRTELARVFFTIQTTTNVFFLQYSLVESQTKQSFI